MEALVRSAGLSLLMGVCCQLYFQALFPGRCQGRGWMGQLGTLAFTAGFLVIACTRIPAYIFQPVRMAAVLVLVSQLFFQAGILAKAAGAVLFVSVYWIWSTLTASLAYAAPPSWQHVLTDWSELLSILLQLFTVLALCLWKKRRKDEEGKQWVRFAWVPVLSLAVTMICSSLFTASGQVQGTMLVLLVLALGLWNGCVFWFVGNLLNREVRLKRLELSREQAHRQLVLYQSMEREYEKQRRFRHDYKNQLLCIQGLLKEEQYQEAEEYLARLTGSLLAAGNVVDTGHPVVNVVLNQKYREAGEKGIAMTMTVNDLSGLTLAEEDVVTLLVNLLDNAIEACERLGACEGLEACREAGISKRGETCEGLETCWEAGTSRRGETCQGIGGSERRPVIRFKMVLEEGQLILSVKNPVKEPVIIEGKTLRTTKREKAGHGLGLQNVDEVVRRNKGTSSLQCRDGWFLFSILFSDV